MYSLNNYTGVGGRNAFANNSTDFNNMFNTANGTTVFKSGVTTASNSLYYSQTFFTSVPFGAGYFGIKTTGFFVPKETGIYSFGIDGDDGVDFLLDGNVITSYYGAHGFGGYRYGTVSLVAGKVYTLTARFQQVGGGWGMQVVWKRPSQSLYSVQSDECYSTKPAEPSKKANVSFYFNNLDATKFLIGSTALSSIGLVDITTSLDSNKINTGYKSTIAANTNGAEWSYVNPNASWLGGNSRLLIDDRQFGNVDPTTINSVNILDAYDGPVTFISNDGTWAQYNVPSPLTKITNGTSLYNSSIRNVNNWNTDYAFVCSVSFGATQSYKSQSVTLTTTNNLATLYNSIVTVSDVYLAFKELANGGLFGNQSGNEFTYGIQYKNADVNDDGVFNESDCFKLLQHLTGTGNIVDTLSLPKTLRLISTDTYNTIGKSNWNTVITPLSNTYSFDINTGKSTDIFDVSTTWKGDVNLSHSTTPKSNGITTMSIKSMNSVISNDINALVMGENVGGKLVITISLDPLQQQVVGTQFQLNYDNTVIKFEKVEFTTKGNPMNYGTNKGNYINIGSLISDGSTTLDKTTEYKITFLPLMGLGDTLGLTSISTTDAVNKDGKQLKIKVN
jgi:hypothetical protein